LVNTTIPKSKGWRDPSQLAIGRALLFAEGPRCAADLGLAIGVHQSNVKKVADRMVGEGLLCPGGRDKSASRRGRNPATYAIAADERENLEAVLEEGASPGTLSRGQQLVVASIPGSKVVDLKRVTAQAGPSSQMEWVALIDGEPQECLMAFAGDHAVDLANDLMSRLAAAEIRCRRATVAQVLLGHRFGARVRPSSADDRS
jgi:hypothetical protein